MKFNQKLAVATAGVALSFAAIEPNPVNPALAATITYMFGLQGYDSLISARVAFF